MNREHLKDDDKTRFATNVRGLLGFRSVIDR